MTDLPAVGLAACPFCGEQPMMDNASLTGANRYWWVSCRGAKCTVRPAGVQCLRELDAIAAWNRRASDPVRSELVEALNRYRYAISWVASDSWDDCHDCRARLEWALAMDPGERLTQDQIAAVGRTFLASEGLVAGPPSAKDAERG